MVDFCTIYHQLQELQFIFDPSISGKKQKMEHKMKHKLKLYSDIRSGSCRRVLALIDHLGLEVEVVQVSILAGETHTAEFLSINPNEMLPVLRDGDMILWEASAIMIHLCETKGDTSLWPTGPARIDVLRWMFWAAEHFRQPAPVYFEENVVAPLMGGTPDQR